MKPVSIQKAKAELAKLIARACAGDEVVISRGKRLLVRLVPVDRQLPQRRFGSLRGQIHLDDTFFDPLPDAELRAWER